MIAEVDSMETEALSGVLNKFKRWVPVKNVSKLLRKKSNVYYQMREMKRALEAVPDKLMGGMFD
jgi:prophage antirepressor-like protein